ncbi:MAG: hypothetical protein AAF607_09625 [Pseudomonadota bacterium]
MMAHLPICGAIGANKRRAKGALATLLCAAFASCGANEPDPTPLPVQSPPAPPQTPHIARLPDGPHMGLIVGFDPLTNTAYDQPARVEALIAQAHAAGASIGRAQISWRDIEIAQGVYATDTLYEVLDAAADIGAFVFVTLETIDISSYEFPDYLRASPDALQPGLSLQSEEVRGALSNMLAFLVPELGMAQVWGLALGNEVDSIIDDGVESAEDMIDFYERAAMRVKALDPDLATTITLTTSAIADQPAFTAAMMDVMDIASFNHYCLDTALQVTGEAQWRQEFDSFKDSAGAKQIFIQELGCPVGYGDDGVGAPLRPAGDLGGSPDIQADYFAFTLNEFASDPQFRAATLFQLLDWSPVLAEEFSAPIAAENQMAGARLEEWLATSGLCRWSDGTCRPGWQVFKDGVGDIAAARP